MSNWGGVQVEWSTHISFHPSVIVIGGKSLASGVRQTRVQSSDLLLPSHGPGADHFCDLASLRTCKIGQCQDPLPGPS